jgi:hypothetical protein
VQRSLTAHGARACRRGQLDAAARDDPGLREVYWTPDAPDEPAALHELAAALRGNTHVRLLVGRDYTDYPAGYLRDERGRGRRGGSAWPARSWPRSWCWSWRARAGFTL